MSIEFILPFIGEDGDAAMEGEIEYVVFDGEVESEERKCDNDDEGGGAIGEEGDHRHGLFVGNLVFHVLEGNLKISFTYLFNYPYRLQDNTPIWK